MKQTVLLFIIALLPLSSLFAQESDTLQREVTIVKEFTPILREAEKINTLPSVAAPSFDRQAVSYTRNVTSTEIPTEASHVEIPYKPIYNTGSHKHRGYFDFGMGAYLTMFANAGYHILDTPHDKLNIAAQFNSLNWDIPVNSQSRFNHPYYEDVTHQTFYDARAGLQYAHTFKDNITLSLLGAYRYLDFNYYGVTNNYYFKDHPFNSVNNFFVELYVGNKEAQHYDYEHWDVTAGYSLYSNRRGAYVTTPSSEHHGYLKGAYSYMLDKCWSVGGEVDFDFLHYGLLKDLSGVAPNIYVPGYNLNVFMARLLPHVEYRKDRFFFRGGVKADISVNDGTIFRFAPDVHMNWEFVENYFLYADIDGGKELHTWNEVSKECIYFDPSFRVPSTYSPVDAKVGFRFRFIPELSFSAFAGYEVAAGALFQSLGVSPQGISWESIDASCFKVGAHIDADIMQYVTVSLDATYREWRGKKSGLVISYDQPRWEGNARVVVHPHKQVDIELGYNMKLDRDFGIYGKLNDMHNLQAKVAYHPLQWLTVFAQGANLLNCKYDYYFGLPAPRIQGMAGVELRF